MRAQLCLSVPVARETEDVSAALLVCDAIADDEQRQRMFNAWLGGLIMVGPFVEVLMMFVVPMLTYWFHLKADRILDDDERLKPKSWCCGFLSGAVELSGLGRLCAFIFVLDGGARSVMGLPYVWRGYPFKAPIIEAEADDAAARKAPIAVAARFAPVNPLALIAQLLARLLDIHSRLPKLCLKGLAMISYNKNLYQYDHSVMVIIWFSIAGALAGLAILVQVLAFKAGHDKTIGIR
eukprot:Skav234473  [mRNA]  locus=scaffold1647:287289:297311:+ [translate_table: standard]